MTDAQSEDISARIEALEMRVTYQDETIESLNKTMTAQWQQLDALNREIVRLRDRVTEAENNTGQAGSTEQPPPHY